MMAHGAQTTDHDEADVRMLETAYDEAWRLGDVEAIVACLAEDAVIVNPRGGVARGHAEIRRELDSLFGGEFAGSKHTSKIVRVSFVSHDVAVLDGEAVVEPADSDAAPLVHGFTDVLVRREGRWIIAHVRAYGLATMSGDQV
jgi:uncharacterized protein (TIGR02246 family)